MFGLQMARFSVLHSNKMLHRLTGNTGKEKRGGPPATELKTESI